MLLKGLGDLMGKKSHISSEFKDRFEISFIDSLNSATKERRDAIIRYSRRENMKQYCKRNNIPFNMYHEIHYRGSYYYYIMDVRVAKRYIKVVKDRILYENSESFKKALERDYTLQEFKRLCKKFGIDYLDYSMNKSGDYYITPQLRKICKYYFFKDEKY